MTEVPHKWVVVKIGGIDPHYRVLAGWSGGYLDADEWRMNSGIVRAELDGNNWNFYGSSGSLYVCNVKSYGFTGMSSQIYSMYKEAHQENFDLVEYEAWNVEDWDWIIK